MIFRMGEYEPYIIPIYRSGMGIFELIDEDLENALKLLDERNSWILYNHMPNRFNSMDEEIAYKQGFEEGRSHEQKQYSEIRQGTKAYNTTNYADKPKTLQKDSRMSSLKSIKLKCPNCKCELYDTQGLNGIYFEHGVQGCLNDKKYVFISYDSLKQESD